MYSHVTAFIDNLRQKTAVLEQFFSKQYTNQYVKNDQRMHPAVQYNSTAVQSC